MSALLRSKGIDTRLIFLPDPFGDDPSRELMRYAEPVLEELADLCADCDLIGITLMTNFFESAVQITEKIRSKLAVPVMWGGVHPTIRPEESLRYADIVCVGEGEEAVCELLDRMERSEPYEDTANMWFKSDGATVKNPVRPLNANLDEYPMPDYSLGEHYYLHEGEIRLMTPTLLKIALEESRGPLSELMPCGYQTMTSRGCPHKCTYCVNDTLQELYGGRGYLRWRSVKHVIDELLFVKREMPYVDHFCFSDDSFFARRKEDIKDFCVRYKEKIGLPFYALGSPMTLTDEKMGSLVEAGLVSIQLGVQTASVKMLGLFNRKQMTNERTMRAISIINKHKAEILPPHYDFILDSPFETDQDKIDTLRFISQIPRPFILHTFSMVLYPGTQLYKMAKAEGIIKSERDEIYNKVLTGGISAQSSVNYLNFLFFLDKRGQLPGWLLRILISGPIVWILNMRIMRPLFSMMIRCYRFQKHRSNRGRG